jgi:hypothetical protein
MKLRLSIREKFYKSSEFAQFARVVEFSVWSKGLHAERKPLLYIDRFPPLPLLPTLFN